MAVILPIDFNVSGIDGRPSFRSHLHTRNFSKWNHKASAKLFLYSTNALICSVYSSFLLAVSRIPRCWKSPSFACLSFYNVRFKYQFWESGFCDVTSGILVSDQPLSGSWHLHQPGVSAPFWRSKGPTKHQFMAIVLGSQHFVTSQREPKLYWCLSQWQHLQ